MTTVTKSFIYAIMLTLNANFYTLLNYDAWLTLQQLINSIPQIMPRWSIPTSLVLLSIRPTVRGIKAKEVDYYWLMRQSKDMLRIRGKSPIMGRFPNMGRCIIGSCDKATICWELRESRLLWGGFLIWGGALFHTRRCCALCLRM